MGILNRTKGQIDKTVLSLQFKFRLLYGRKIEGYILKLEMHKLHSNQAYRAIGMIKAK